MLVKSKSFCLALCEREQGEVACVFGSLEVCMQPGADSGPVARQLAHTSHVQRQAVQLLTISITLLRSSLLLAKSLHTSIIRQGSSLLDKQSIRSLRSFRFCAIKEGPDVRLFTHPATLSRLAMWLMDATRDKWAAKAEKQKMKSLPFVVACRDEGAEYAASQGQGQGGEGMGGNGNGTGSGTGNGANGVGGQGGKGWIVVGITGGMEDGDVRKKCVFSLRCDSAHWLGLHTRVMHCPTYPGGCKSGQDQEDTRATSKVS